MMDILPDETGQWLVHIMEGKNIKQLHGLSVWELKAGFWGSSGYDNRRQQILAKVLCDFPGAFLEYDEDPEEDGLQGTWDKKGTRTWVVPTDCDLSEVYSWLRLGNWMLYVSDQIIDYHLVPEYSGGWSGNGLVDLMKRCGIEIVISASHDNDPWLVGVNV